MTFRKLRSPLLALVAVLALTAPGFLALRPSQAAPVPEAGAGDALARVKIEYLAGLLKSEAVRKDLGLTEVQKGKLEGMRTAEKARRKKELDDQLKKALEDPDGPPQVFPPGLGLGTDLDTPPGYAKALTAALTPAQVRRLKQITLQVHGPAVLLDRHVIRALVLTAEQEDRLEAVVPARSLDLEPLVIVDDGKEDPFLAKQAAERAANADKAWAEGLKVLTPAQRGKWDRLIGTKLPTRDLQKVAGLHFEEMIPDGQLGAVGKTAPAVLPPKK